MRKKDPPHQNSTGVVNTNCNQGSWRNSGIKGKCNPVIIGKEPKNRIILITPPTLNLIMSSRSWANVFAISAASSPAAANVKDE